MVEARVAAELSVAPMVMDFDPSAMVPLRVPDIATVPSWVEFAAAAVGTLPKVRSVTTAGVVTVILPLLEMDGLLPVSPLVAVNDRILPVESRAAVIP